MTQTGDKLIIRKAENRDATGIETLLYEVHKVHSDLRPDLFIPGQKKYDYAELCEILLSPDKTVFVAEYAGAILGYVFCFEQDFSGHGHADVKTLYIDDVCVEETARGLKIGTALYSHVMNFAKEKGFYNVTLNVWTGNNSALAFYQSMGMHPMKTCLEKIVD